MIQDWLPFLTSAVRLVDLHDSGHTPRAQPVAPSEQRAGNGDGLWLDLALQLLEYVRERDTEVNESWVPLDEFWAHIRRRHPHLLEQDIHFVVTTLSTPCTITLLRDAADAERPVPYATKDTALLERPAHKALDRCRLTQTGRLAIALSRAGQSWLYAHHDAEKIVSAIKYGEFDLVPTHCAYVAQSIRNFGHEITRALERPGTDALLKTFLGREQNYREAIGKVQAAVEAATDLLSLDETRRRLDDWLTTHRDTDLSLYALHRSLVRLMQSVERLGRHFADFIARVMSQNRETIGGVRFDKLAVYLAYNPPLASTLAACLRAVGPWSMTTACIGPEDVVGSLRGELASAPPVEITFDDEMLSELPSCMERFLSAYRDQILTALQAGPLSLQSAIDRGWLSLDGEAVLSQLVGVYAAPAWLSDGDRLVVAFQPHALNALLGNGSVLRGDDFVLALARTEACA